MVSAKRRAGGDIHRRARGEKELGDGTMGTTDSALEAGVVNSVRSWAEAQD